MKRLMVSLLAFVSISYAQTPPPSGGTSPNLVNTTNSQSSGWVGTIPTTSTGAGYEGGETPGYNSTTNTIMFGYTQGTAAYTYAFSQALRDSGMTILGYNYSWEYINHGESRGSLSAAVNFAGTSGLSLHNRTWTLGQTGANWETFSGSTVFGNSLLAANIANFSLTFSGRDDRGWAGYYGPQVRNPSLALNYTFDACLANPLSSPTCAGYEAAYLTQQCTVNPLYSQSCPGYASAYLTQQCVADPLYSTTCAGYTQAVFDQQCRLNPLYDQRCPGYQTAYFNQQCTADPMYSTSCPGYSAAYTNQQCTADPFYSVDCPGYAAANAKKNIVAAASTSTTTTSVLAQATTADSITTQLSSGIADPTVSSIVSSSKTTAASAETSPAAPVKLTAPAPAAPTQVAKVEPKKEEKGNSTSSAAENKPNDKPKTTKEAIAEKRREAAVKEAVAKGKELANEMGKAADMQAQMAVQNVIIQAMGFTPGFDSYNRYILPDNQFYKPYTIYNNQRNVDTPAGRGLFGGSDKTHAAMVDSQYNLGN